MYESGNFNNLDPNKFNSSGRPDKKLYGENVVVRNKSYEYHSDTVSIGTWILILLGTGIPIVNIIVIIGLSFGSQNETLRNFGKASLILLGIGIVLAVLLGGCRGF